MELEKCITEITRLRSEIHAKDLWGNPGDLSDIMVKLGVWNNYLGAHIPRLHKEATDEAFRQFKAHEHMGATKAKEYSKGKSTQHRHDYENAKLIYSATENLLSLLQSRLRVIENEIKRNY